jgi:hypothetical protein
MCIVLFYCCVHIANPGLSPQKTCPVLQELHIMYEPRKIYLTTFLSPATCARNKQADLFVEWIAVSNQQV